jgi:ethanolamine utilization protein EutN
MRIAEVIGTVTLNRMHPSVAGYRWVIGIPLSLKALRDNLGPDGEDQVILDQLGAGFGQRIGFSEGAEAAAPFAPEKKPIDSYCSLLLDKVVVEKPV